MDRQKIEAKVKGIIAEQLGIDESEIKLESTFIEDLGADSLDIVELVIAVEDEFNLADPIPDEVAEKCRTVSDAVEYLATALQPAANPAA